MRKLSNPTRVMRVCEAAHVNRKLQKMEFEIRDQPHEMWVEGTSDDRPNTDDILAEVEKRGFLSGKLEIFHDDMQGFWRFSVDIRRANPHERKP